MSSASQKLINAVIGIGGSAVGIAIHQNLSGAVDTTAASAAASSTPAIASPSPISAEGKQVQ